ncbi:Hypothetical protein BN2458_PEG1552 [Helicobacter typhlonius]|uniref:Uncharacterized protein n=1 Tax=Helicobacter typhlonius TaxID=76936 RepID=A0A0S4PVW9_9HELI|nr:Hypothetical protein BN2458_PEG1552 [Helicobacter typhlonius]
MYPLNYATIQGFLIKYFLQNDMVAKVGFSLIKIQRNPDV